MANERQLNPTTLVIFGAGGDLTRRKLLPALYNLYLDGWLPVEQFAVIGIDLKKMSEAQFRRHIREGIEEFSRQGAADGERWQAFAGRLSYFSADFTKATAYKTLSQQLAKQEQAWDKAANRIFYLAIAPSLVQGVAEGLGKTNLAEERERARIVVEKPFGRDLASARALNEHLAGIFGESQIYRIDHYLGKETVQNILAFRFANMFLEPIWNRRYIDHVQITVAEAVGVEHRGGYYERAGALRDMIQNHLFQVLCLVAMEPPVSFQADEIRNKKVDVLHAIRLIQPEQVHQVAVRGQYGAGKIDGNPLPAYREESNVDPHSTVETFAALKLFIDNWRWQDVPFYLRTGKRLPAKLSQVVVTFRPVPRHLFPTTALENWHPNRLIINIQPDEGIVVQIQAKLPGPVMLLRPAEMRFLYREAFESAPPEAYETLLLDLIEGDATLFMRADQVEAAWSVVTPVLEVWQAHPPADFPDYPAGSWGPEHANTLITRDGRSWFVAS